MKLIKETLKMSHTRSFKLGRAPTLKVNVTKEIIEDSIRANSNSCMIAEAIKESYPDAKYVAVDIQTIRWSDTTKRERYTYLTPRVAQIAIVNFDQGEDIKPLQFQLRDGQATIFGTTERSKIRNREWRSAQLLSEKKREKRAFMRTVAGGNKLSTIPERVGGKTPPVAALHHPPIAGNRRVFGLRTMSRKGI